MLGVFSHQPQREARISNIELWLVWLFEPWFVWFFDGLWLFKPRRYLTLIVLSPRGWCFFSTSTSRSWISLLPELAPPSTPVVGVFSHQPKAKHGFHFYLSLPHPPPRGWCFFPSTTKRSRIFQCWTMIRLILWLTMIDYDYLNHAVIVRSSCCHPVVGVFSHQPNSKHGFHFYLSLPQPSTPVVGVFSHQPQREARISLLTEFRFS